MDDELKREIERLREKKAVASLGGGVSRIEAQHASGRLTARERVEHLLDPNSFTELDMLGAIGEDREKNIFGDGIVVGYGKIDGRRVCIFSQDYTVHSGSTGQMHRHKMCTISEKAMDIGIPLIGLWDSAGGRLQTESYPTPGYTSLFTRFTNASGIIPQISAVLGPAVGNGGYGVALTDFIFMVDEKSYAFATGPWAVKEVLGEGISMEELGGAKVHCQLSGLADLRVKTEDECFAKIRTLLSYLPSNNKQAPLRFPNNDNRERTNEEFGEIVPSDSRKVYNMRQVITHLLDNGEFFEIKPEFAREAIVGFGRLDGYSVGIIANQPLFMAGALTIDASDKQARFIRFCDCFNIPLIFLVDTTGYLPGRNQEHGGILRHGAKVLFAVVEAVVPKVAVLIRKVYGGAKPAMAIDKDMDVDHIYAWPIAEGSIMGAEATVEVLFRKEIAKAENPEEFKRQKVEEFKEASRIYSFAYPGVINDIIEPRETRQALILTLESLRGKEEIRRPKRHGNIPL